MSAAPREPTDQPVAARGKFLRCGDRLFWVRGVSYGPFGDVGGGEFLERGVTGRDLDGIAGLGANVVRVYVPPPRWFLDACGERGLRVMAGLAWETHVDFLRLGQMRERVLDGGRRAVAAAAGHPALLGWIVGNEIESSLVRWMGRVRVQRFLERLIDVCRGADAGVLYGYANYPSTEYLNPRNADFVGFNVFLESEQAMRGYLRRLQVLAGDRPLVITESGADSAGLGESVQAEMLGWGTVACADVAAAGVVLYSYTDAWWRGGGWVSGWRFGLVDEGRRPKPALAAVREAFGRPPRWAFGGVGFDRPTVSVIVCTFNGQRTLVGCLESLRRLDYPGVEVLVVDDGSEPPVDELVRGSWGMRVLRLEHGGLGAARNAGAAVARGEVLAFTDDDCVVDVHWLAALAGAFDDPEVVAAGGPNVPPEPRNRTEACVGVAPGAPVHVLLDDRRAEHLPGCNLAVRRDAFERVGGFRARYRAAGDDVDFCWRLIEGGGAIVFVPGAMVWHHRRATCGAYFRQQRGYGWAEALLIGDHPGRFGRTGGARWRGAVYHGGEAVSAADPGASVYQGVFGVAPYQFVYGGGRSPAPLELTGGFRWVVSAGLLAAGGLWFWPCWVLAVSMLGVTVVRAAVAAWRPWLPDGWRGCRARWLLFVFHLVQPVLRGGARWLGCLVHRCWPRGRREAGVVRRLAGWSWWRRETELALWSESGVGRDDLLSGAADGLAGLGWGCGGPFDDFDFVCAGHWGTALGLRSATEFHGGGRCLTRVGVWRRRWCWPRLVPAGVVLVLGGSGLAGWEWAGGGLLVVVVGLWSAGRLGVARVAGLVAGVAEGLGMRRVDG